MSEKNIFVFINENARLLSISNNPNEGGLVRNIAIAQWIEKNVSHLRNIKLKKNPYTNILIVIYILLTIKKTTLFLQYITVGIPLFHNSFFGSILRQIFLSFIKYCIKRNKVIIDISDLKYEQSLDLNLNNDRLSIIKAFEEKFFIISNIHFIFASNSMKNYAVKKYSINPDYASVLENGNNKLLYDPNPRIKPNPNILNYIYAGTLNQGRNILNMIKQFPEKEFIHLYLIGSGGGWIKNIRLKSNVSYLGMYSNVEAQQLASHCDMGLIPYDQNLLYYNLAFPTKLSFYITAGIPFLSTYSHECKLISDSFNVGYIHEIDKWKVFIGSLSKNEIVCQKEKINSIKENFYWDNIIKKSILNNFR